MASDRTNEWLEGEVLEKDHPGPREDGAEEAPEQSWIERNRGFIEQGKTLAQTVLIVSPPPARLALAALSVAADGMLLVEDMRSGKLDAHHARLRAGGIALEGLALVAASRLAPAILARNHRRLQTIRHALSRMEAAAAAKAR